jgi:hypothetical protein
MPGREFSVELPGEPDKCQHPCLGLAGVGRAFASALAGSLRAAPSAWLGGSASVSQTGLHCSKSNPKLLRTPGALAGAHPASGRALAQAKALIADSGMGVRDLVGVILRERCAVVSTLEQA